MTLSCTTESPVRSIADAIGTAGDGIDIVTDDARGRTRSLRVYFSHDDHAAATSVKTALHRLVTRFGAVVDTWAIRGRYCGERGVKVIVHDVGRLVAQRSIGLDTEGHTDA